MFKSPIVPNGNEVYGSDLRKSSGSLAGKVAAANGYTLGSDAVLRHGHNRHSSTDSVKSLNSINSSLSNGYTTNLSKEKLVEESVASNGHAVKSFKSNGLVTAAMKTFDSAPNANGDLASHCGGLIASSSAMSRDKSHKHVDFSSSLRKYVSIP